MWLTVRNNVYSFIMNVGEAVNATPDGEKGSVAGEDVRIEL